MVEPASRAEQPSQRHGTSRLRNEITSEHTDGGQGSESDSFKVSDSQIAVYETQLRDYPEEVPDGELPLSPNSAAVIQLHGADNTETRKEFTSFNLLTRPTQTKEVFQSQNSFPPRPSVDFTFGQPPKPSSKHVCQVSKPATMSFGAKEVEADHDITERPPPPSTKPTPVVDDLLQHCVADQDSFENAPTVSLSVQHDTATQFQQRDNLLDVPSKIAPSAQPIATTANKHGVAKKGKRGKKTLKQQRGVPWPPRPSAVSAYITKISSNIDIGSKRSSSVKMASPPAIPEDHGAMQLRSPHTSKLELQLENFQGTQPVDSHLPQDAISNHSMTHGHELGENDQVENRKESHVFQKHAEEQSPDFASHRPHKHPVASIKDLPKADLPICEHPESMLPLPSEDESRSPAAASQSGTKRIQTQQSQQHPRWDFNIESVSVADSEARDHGKNTTELNDQSFWAVRKKTAGSGGNSQLVDTVLHGISAQQPSHRVQKMQKKRTPSTLSQRPTAAAILQQFASNPIDFDQALQTLRAAHFAEQHRKEQDASTKAKHEEEVKGLLQDQVKQLSASVADWKDRYDSLLVNVVQLREKAKTNQKYVSGLQKDHEKLKKSTTIVQEDCKRVLQQNISEVECEKKILQQELEKTLGVVEKGQNCLRKTVDELYKQLIISQSKSRGLEENLTKQAAMYEAEKAKCTDLENRLLASVQDVQRQLGEYTANMADNIGTLQDSVDGIDAKVTQEPGVQRCLEALQKMQDTSLLTVKNVRKAEDMLRFIHEGVCSKLDALTQSDQSKIDLTGEFRSFIGEQLKNLRSDMLKYDEVVAEGRKAQDLSDALGQQLSAEQQQTQQLSEQLSGIRRNEAELQARTTRLERHLVEARDKTKEVSALEKNIQELRDQIKAVQDECKVAKAELERAERNLLKRDRKEVDYKKSIEILKDENQRLELENNAKASTAAELRRKIQEELRQEFAKSESVFRNDIHRLTNERDEERTKIQDHNKSMEAAKERCEEAKRRTEEMKSELEAARIEKRQTEARLKITQDEAQNNSSAASELTELKEHLRQKMEELEDKSEGIRRLETVIAELETSKADLQVMCEQQQFEISQHSLTIESLRHETEAERDEERERHHTANKLSQDQKETVIKEKEKIQELLEQTRSNESKLSNARTDLIEERDDLRLRIAELEKAKSIAETQVTKAQQDRDDLVHKQEEELEDLRRRHEQTETALKDAEAKAHLQKIEHSKKIDFDFQKYESKYRSLTEELNSEKAKIWEANNGDMQQLPAPAMVQCPPSRSLDTSRPSKSRRKVNRENQSVLNVVGSPGTLVNTTARQPSTVRDGFGSKAPASPTFDDNLFSAPGSITGSDELLEDHGLSIIDPAAEQLEDTQIVADFMIPIGEYGEEAHDTSNKSSVHPGSIPADQSSLSESPPSDELAQLIDDIGAVHTPKQHERGPNLLLGRSPEERVLETPLRKVNGPMSGIRPSQSQERPRSQANTASRMMPPPGSIFSHFGQDKSSPDASAAVGRGESTRKPEHHLYGINRVSSGQLFSITRSTPTRLIDPQICENNSSAPSARQHGQKRGGAFDQGKPSKRQQQSSPYVRAEQRSRSSHHFRSTGSRPSDVGALSTNNHTSPARSSGSQVSKSKTSAQKSSSEIAQRPIDRTSPNGRDTKPRNHHSSTLRSSAIVHAPRYYGRHQTRSKTQEAERFDREIRGR
ncbi:hypothetical protein BDU57DRAFT_79114 [Ampelomyces quisqualis]|uniref:Uncharacterized protein n=1 Tax=Ampelomyces quisqualis TaxID=50730 RepID=A0A6A5QB92_AMPQU|nr:hypothetical protein BDU57DRAFT_79114 [Ampelomyces quisqualis]